VELERSAEAEQAASSLVEVLAEVLQRLLEPPMDQVSPEPQEASDPVAPQQMSVLERQAPLHPAQPREAWAGITYQHLQP
jgi:hypothetical protein